MKRPLLSFLLIFCGALFLSGYAQISVPEVLYLQGATAVEGCPGSEIDNAIKIWSNSPQNLTVTRTFYTGADCEGEPGSVSTFEIAPLGLITPVILKITLPEGMRSCKFSVASQGLNTDVCIPFTVKPVPTRLYVNAGATGANTGLTWTDAFTDLQSALNYSCSGNLTEIWVAKGTYKPTTGSDRSISFVMKNGVAIYGGFSGNGSETQLSHRNWRTNATILSGDINTQGVDTDNTYRVINNNFTAGSPLNNTAVLDGFIVEKGYANGGFPLNLGGGMWNAYASPKISNCIFTNNHSDVFGGAILNFNGANGVITNCIFTGNSSTFGRAVANYESGPTYTNCSFVANLNGFSAIQNIGSPAPTYINCISWGNGEEIANSNSSPVVRNSIIQGGYTPCTNCPNGNGNADPLFVNAAGGDFRLQPCSPAINAGDPATTSAMVGNVDLAGNPRFFNNGRVDIGAYEYQSTQPVAITPIVTPTNPTTCGGTNGSISLSGFLNNTTYSVAYKKDNNAVAAANFTSDGTGVITLTGLGAGNYTDIVAIYGTCVSNAATATLNEPTKPRLTLSTIPDICTGAMSFTIPYTNPTQSPNKYSVLGAGITTVNDGDLSNPITVALSDGAAGSSISFTLTVKNTTTNCVSEAIMGSVAVNPVSVGGTVGNAQTICAGTPPADLTLSNQVGNVVKWQKSTDVNFATFSDINVTSTTLTTATIGNLTADTYFRAVVKSGLCAEAYSAPVLITVNPVSVGGTVSSAQTICAGTAPADLSLSNQVGNVVKWQKSTDVNFATFSDINAASTTLTTATIGNLTANTYFRAVVQNGVCAEAYSAPVLITANANSVGGTVGNAQTICAGTAPADLSLSNQVGNVVKWQKSTDVNFATFSDINATSTTLTTATIGNLTADTYFRAVVKSGLCAEAYSAPLLITVNPVSVGGTVSSAQTICAGTAPADLTLSNQVGNVVKWQKSTDVNFTTFSDINATSTTLTTATIGNLTADTYFRAVVKSGLCPEAYSAPLLITANANSVGGTVGNAQTICAGTAPADLSLSNQVGNVVKWQKSADVNFTTFSDINATSTTLTTATIGNLTADTYFRAVVKSGLCPEAYSAPLLITVNANSVGGTAGNAQTICAGTAPADLTLSNQVGNVVKWQKSTDVNFATFSDINAASTTLTTATIGNLTADTYFRAVVQSGVCSQEFSEAVLITVNPLSAGGTVGSAQTICSGTAPVDLSLSNQVGNVVKWQKSTDVNFTTFSDINATSTTLTTATIGNLTADTYFRAVVQSGVCAEVFSSPVLITVNPLSAGGMVGSAQTICSGTAPADLTLSNQVGYVLKWQKSTDVNFSNPVDIVATNTTLTSATIGNLTANTYFRAAVQSGVCAETNSSPVLVTVAPQPVEPAIMVKTPNTAAICFGSAVSATFYAGSGGVGCTDDFIVSIDGANPVAYTPGSNVGATATTSILIQGRRANCSTGAGCNGTDYTPLAFWTVNPLPTASILNNSSPFCAPGNASFTLSGTNGATLTYTLTGLAGNQTLLLDGTNQTINANTVSADITLTLLSVTKNDCPVMLAATATVTVYPLPTDFALSGGGISFCQTPLSIATAGSQTGVSYQLKRNNVNLGSTIEGTGNPLNFSGLTQAGTYTVVATTSVGNCPHTLSDQITIQTRNAPTAYNLTGGGASCSGTPVSIILSNSQIGVLYQLKRGNNPVGNPVPGTGNALSFPPQNTPGNYTALAMTQCADLAMNNTVTINSVVTPSTFTVTGGGASCGTALPVGLSDSQSGVFYQLYRNNNPVGTTVQGTGQPITLGNHLTQGQYTIVATRAGECPTTMSGSLPITLIDPPALFNLTGGGAACPGGVPISLSSSQNGIQYQLKRGNTVVSNLPGTDNPLFFPNQTVAGTYTVEAISQGNCTRTMSGNAIVTTAGTLPNVYSMTGGGAFCNNLPVALGLSDSQKSVYYQLQRNTPSGFVNVGTSVQGTGSALALGTHSTLGEYRVVVNSACLTEMTGRKSITACNARVAVDSDFSQQRTAHMTHEFVRVMPNPVSKTLHLKVHEAKGQKVTVNLLDVSGKTLLQRAFVPESNQHQEEFEVSEIAAGMYFIQVKTADKQATLKVVKVE